MPKKGEIINRVGEKYITHQQYIVEIIQYYGAHNCTIVFNDTIKTILSNISYGNIKKGTLSNPNKPNIYGVGYIGQGKYNSKIHKKIYTTWHNLLRRCYCDLQRKNNPTYKGCSVDERWHNFQNFAKWYEENYKEGFYLDKDILIKGNKIYSPETCCFVPEEINNLFVTRKNKRGNLPLGVHKHFNKYKAQIAINGKTIFIGSFTTPEEAFEAYRVAKKQRIKDKANMWKDKINIKVYKALINYEIQITD